MLRDRRHCSLKLTRAPVQKHKSDVAELIKPITRGGGVQLRQAPAHFNR